MRKKLLAFITVLALAVSAMGMTAFAEEVEGTVSEKTTYTLTSGSYMASTTANNGTEYTYNVELKEDGTYTYLVEFTMGGTVYSNTESGTYKIEDSVATFTAVTSEIKEGEIYTIELVANDSFTWTRLASYFSIMSGRTADIVFGKVVEESAYTLSEGTYTATTTANNGTVYTYNVELKEDGTYTYLVEFTMGGTVYSNTESGTYKVEDSVVTFTAVTSEIKEGETYTIELAADDSFTWTRLASYFSIMSGRTADIAFAKDAVEDEVTDKEETEEVVTQNAAGKYAVDISAIPFMDAMLDPVLELDAEKGTFKVYNASEPETSKGSGTVAFDEATGVYTLTYTADVKEENIGETTTYTYDAETDTITFTSALLYGNASFNIKDETTGEFIPYTAVLMKETEEDTTTDKETEDTETEDTTTDKETEDTTKEETKEETKEDVTADKNEAPKTADNSPVAFYAIAALAALGAAVVFTKKRNA